MEQIKLLIIIRLNFRRDKTLKPIKYRFRKHNFTKSVVETGQLKYTPQEIYIRNVRVATCFVNKKFKI